MIISLAGITIAILAICVFSNSNQLLMQPLTTPESFLAGMPYVKYSTTSGEIIFIQPSSSFLVYALGAILICFGIYFYLTRTMHLSRKYWGVGLILWGISAIVAGTSYQAFGYELKCASRDLCLYTSNFELVYMLLTAYSINYLVAATAYTSLRSEGRKWLLRFAVIDSIFYTIYLFIGAVLPIRFLVSYEGFMAFIGANFILMFILNILHFKKHRDPLNRNLIWIWLGFLVVNLGYFVFLFGGIGRTLYENSGFWFNENDMLHVLLISWGLMVFFLLRRKLSDTCIVK